MSLRSPKVHFWTLHSFSSLNLYHILSLLSGAVCRPIVRVISLLIAVYRKTSWEAYRRKVASISHAEGPFTYESHNTSSLEHCSQFKFDAFVTAKGLCTVQIAQKWFWLPEQYGPDFLLSKQQLAPSTPFIYQVRVGNDTFIVY